MSEGLVSRTLFRAEHFIRHELWTHDSVGSSRLKRIATNILKWIIILVDGVNKDRVFLRASALTYATILSIVPFLAVAFSVLKGLGFQNTPYIRDILLEVAAGREQIVDTIIEYINKTNVSTLGAVGTGFLFFTVISLLSNIENSFNTIWAAKRSRPVGRKIADYISVSLVFPVLIIVAISATATMQNNEFVQSLLEYSIMSEMYVLFLKVLPYLAVWAALAFLYKFFPNTKVQILPAIYGAIIAGTIWQIAQWFYVEFQVGVARSNAIYGSFAQLPIFLVWLYASWAIVLIGAEMCFTFQNFRHQAREAKYETLSEEERQRVGLALLVTLTENFFSRQQPPTLREIAGRLGLPRSLVEDTIYILAEAGFVGIMDAGEEERVSLIKSPDHIRIQDVVDHFAQRNYAGSDDVVLDKFPRLVEAFRLLHGCIAESEHNLSLAGLADLHRTAREDTSEPAESASS
ncbi:hypothetical protein DPQ33_07605 [Oceanidesulfovibrio indonesiensis]|uniref:Uncharacterized protein n=1 Tax=Oceanidesulfovibrio indonesiensis TaxID=54767 RepID=A0A7M3MFS4_9BACT|nr:YhjD/YihY/BrkB family envelope integrity protein [Oceanidesulfovibrio indonesiensis]TVM17966.1 hypothetical protein DPQ33_07605 [Oceanidesulfovibrio indonesiensis]